MLEYQSSNLHVVTHEVSGAARSVQWGCQSLKSSSNAVWGGTGLSHPRGPARFCAMRLGLDFYPSSPPPTLFLRRHSALPDGRH